MPDKLEGLCGLVEIRAARHREPLARLWEKVFAAIHDGKLDFAYPDEFKPAYGSLKHRIPLVLPGAPDDGKTHIEILCTSALRAIENGDAFPPWTQLWVRRMLVSAAAFDKALFPADQKQPVGRDNQVNPFADFLIKTFPDGVPAGVTREDIARMAKGVVGIVSLKTVSRAKKRAKKLLSKGTN